jgi:hypothetical protein
VLSTKYEDYGLHAICQGRRSVCCCGIKLNPNLVDRLLLAAASAPSRTIGSLGDSRSWTMPSGRTAAKAMEAPTDASPIAMTDRSGATWHAVRGHRSSWSSGVSPPGTWTNIRRATACRGARDSDSKYRHGDAEYPSCRAREGGGLHHVRAIVLRAGRGRGAAACRRVGAAELVTLGPPAAGKERQRMPVDQIVWRRIVGAGTGAGRAPHPANMPDERGDCDQLAPATLDRQGAD